MNIKLWYGRIVDPFAIIKRMNYLIKLAIKYRRLYREMKARRCDGCMWFDSKLGEGKYGITYGMCKCGTGWIETFKDAQCPRWSAK